MDPTWFIFFSLLNSGKILKCSISDKESHRGLLVGSCRAPYNEPGCSRHRVDRPSQGSQRCCQRGTGHHPPGGRRYGQDIRIKQIMMIITLTALAVIIMILLLYFTDDKIVITIMIIIIIKIIIIIIKNTVDHYHCHNYHHHHHHHYYHHHHHYHHKVL